MDLREKLQGFPNVYYVTLENSIERHKFMEEQFNKYGINGKPYFSKKITDMNPQPSIENLVINIGLGGLGCAISHINSLKYWYDNTDEEYAIFCEDDHDFSTLEHWSFTWKEFMDNLPKGWECVQLIKLIDPIGPNFWHALKLEMTYGRWWGSLGLMKRSWVKRVLDRHIIGENKYNMYMPDGIAMAENVLYWDIGTIYNLPLFTENNTLPSSIHNNDYNYLFSKVPHRMCEIVVKDFWKELGPTLKVEDLLRI